MKTPTAPIETCIYKFCDLVLLCTSLYASVYLTLNDDTITTFYSAEKRCEAVRVDYALRAEKNNLRLIILTFS